MVNNITKEEVIRKLIQRRHWYDEEIGQTLGTIDRLEKGINWDGKPQYSKDNVRNERIYDEREELKRLIKDLKVNEYCLQLLQEKEYITLSNYYEEYA